MARIQGEPERVLMLEPSGHGYHEARCRGLRPGDSYMLDLDGDVLRPDPASRAQAGGVHGPSEIVDPSFPWSDGTWRGLPLADYVFYEIHVGTFTPDGTFDAVIARLDDLRALGVTCLEVMPISQFPGDRNWGYDGVLPYAAQRSYGGLDGFRRLVDACHSRGLAVCLDVVYNHLGPEGNYLRDFGPYFTSKYHTPWGEALNFDDHGADDVRHYFLENVRWWIEDVHVDALRLDAVHAIFDQSAWPFLTEVADLAKSIEERVGRAVHVIAESDLHDPRMVRPKELGGFGMDAEWNDDLHHAVHALLTGERSGYYSDFGTVGDLASVYNEGYAHAGRWTAYRGRRHGAPATGVDGKRFVVCVQNHDQVGNRLGGERLSSLVSFESLKLAAGAMLLSPHLPLLFMGEEYGETAPFLYFVDHGDPALMRAVREGRQREFASFGWKEHPPDPGSDQVFASSRIEWVAASSDEARSSEDHSGSRQAKALALRGLYAELLRLRREHPALGAGSRENVSSGADEKRGAVWMRRVGGGREVMVVFNFSEEEAEIPVAAASGEWRTMLCSSERRWLGPGAISPPILMSDGELRPRLSGRAFILLDREET